MATLVMCDANNDFLFAIHNARIKCLAHHQGDTDITDLKDINRKLQTLSDVTESNVESKLKECLDLDLKVDTTYN